ncbi:lead, cadmium, zinc and mercury transporting ATPase [Lachnospiraceae bacterium KM106-2]|nr:lead, cadmium, zinc and mercury transporting ATPase [Lachnospiraceae bacterium KM106-2]
MDWHSKSISQVTKELDVSIENGLSEKEALQRLEKYGANEIAEQKNTSLIVKFFAQFKDFMIITLIIAAFISLFVSYLKHDLDLVDPVIIMAIIILNAILGVFQEAKAEKSLEALKKLSSPTALVKRNGTIQNIASNQLVPGDIIFLESGCLVPADARLLQAVNLKVEESSLTGESHPVEKVADVVLAKTTLLSERKNLIMSSSIVTYGRGSAIVTNTGMDTEVGHIANMIMNDESPMTPLQKKLAKTSKTLGIAALLICIIIFIIGILKQKPVFDMFMTSVSLAVAAIPEGLPAIVTIMLSLGVQRMAKKNAVIRKLPAVETLGGATIICSDKTGTLTQNKMVVSKIASVRGEEHFQTDFSKSILQKAALCNDAILQIEKREMNITGEPTEAALVMAAYEENLNKLKLDLTYKRMDEIPFDSSKKRMTTVHKMIDGTYEVITKGAPEVLLSLCSYVYDNGTAVSLTSYHRMQIQKQNILMAGQALRVIAVAYKQVRSYDHRSLENSLVFLGLIGMIDPPRPEVKEAVHICKRAGIKPVMITGDHILTACAIGKELGMISSKNEAISGKDLNAMKNEDLVRSINRYSVFARVSPEHKVRIVKAFQENGDIVAMTGDGVNDAPALKSSDIGCAMGITGTDVAKNAADMILTDDNFATIVSAVREGRGIYDNIKKAVHFLLSSNIGEIITIFIAIILGLPTPLVAVQLLWVNLVTDSLPAISLGVEPTDHDIMKRKPISPKKGMFADGMGIRIIVEGIMIGFLALSAFLIGYRIYDPAHLYSAGEPLVGRTMCFAVLSMSQLFHAFNMKSRHSIFNHDLFNNKQLITSFLLGILLQVLVISIPTLSIVFKVTALTLEQWGIVFLLSAMPILIVELQKKANQK